MAEAEEEKSFVVRDRRNRGEEQEPQSARPSSSPSSSPRVTTPEAGQAQSAGSTQDSAPPVNFSSFVFSLSTSAMMLMGEQLDPQQRQMPVNIPQAKEIIDILSMLEEKTRGNLTSDEQSVITDMLYALRMKYVDVASGKATTR